MEEKIEELEEKVKRLEKEVKASFVVFLILCGVVGVIIVSVWF